MADPPTPPGASPPRALVCNGQGLGDIIQTTPLIAALDRLGYAVDVWMVPNYPETVELFQGWPCIRRLIVSNRGVVLSRYDKIVVSLQFPHNAFMRRLTPYVSVWGANGEANQAERELLQARRLGYEGPMPPTYAGCSARRFDLPPRTVALHPGSNPGAWNRGKRWPYFPALAKLLRCHGFHVAVVGGPDDGDEGDWPDGTLDFRSRLRLMDTGALMRQCAAVVANDAGLAHYAAALGVPTFVIFGPTSPEGYRPPVANAFPVRADVPCRPCTIKESCPHRPCLLALGPREVADRLVAHYRASHGPPPGADGLSSPWHRGQAGRRA
jgi:ADP-heptose:LPS heptosyltransferase